MPGGEFRVTYTDGTYALQPNNPEYGFWDHIGSFRTLFSVQNGHFLSVHGMPCSKLVIFGQKWPILDLKIAKNDPFSAIFRVENEKADPGGRENI